MNILIRTILISGFIFICLPQTTSSQIPDTLWTKTFGGIYSDWGLSAEQTTDGGFIITGQFSSGIDYFIGLLKTDGDGNLEWLKSFSGNTPKGSSVKQTSDGGYIIAGNNFSSGTSNDVYLIKTDLTGNYQWAKTYGGTDHDFGRSVKQTQDGGYIISGYTSSFGAGSNDVWLIKVDSNGNQDWAKTFGGIGNDAGYGVEIAADGGYVAAGAHNSFGAGDYDVGLLKTDANGNLLWLKSFGGPLADVGLSVKKTTDGGFVIIGYTESFSLGGKDVWLVKTDSDGELEWSKNYGGFQDDEGRSVDQTADGGFILTGITESFGVGSIEVGVLKTDSVGNLLWITTIGGADSDFGQAVQQTTDGGYIIAGSTGSFGAGEQDVWLIKFESDVSNVEEQIIVNDYNLYQNYPNPFNPTTTINYQIPEISFVTLKVFDVLGKEIASLVDEEKSSGSYEVEFNAVEFPSGVYFYQLQAGNFIETKKMVLLR